MTTTYTDQWSYCVNYLYSHGGHYVLCEGNVDLFGFPVIGGGYRDIRLLTRDEALTIKLAPLQALRHAAGVEQEER